MRNFFKIVKLSVQQKIIFVKRRMIMFLGMSLCVLSIILFLLILFTTAMHRLPVFSYFIHEMNLPLTLKITGKIEVYREDVLDENVIATINIGGYGKRVYSGDDYELVFSAANIENIPVVVNYQLDGEIKTYVEYISYSQGDYISELHIKIYD